MITHDRDIAAGMPRQMHILDGRIVADTNFRAVRLSARLDGMAAMTRTRPAAIRPADLVRISSTGIGTRKLRASLSALGIAIGVAAIVAVLGLSSSSQAGLLAQIDRLGTNLLTVTNGQTVFGQPAELPTTAPAMINRLESVTGVEQTGLVNGVDAYRSTLIPKINTNSLLVQAASVGLLGALKTGVAHDSYLNAAI